MKRLLPLTALLISVLLLLTGCVSVDYQVAIKSDGTGTISYTYTFDKDFLNSDSGNTADDTSAESTIDNMKQAAEASGFTVQDYSDDTTQGIKAAKDIQDITSDLDLSELFGSNIKDSADNNIQITKGALSIKYSQNASFDLTGMKGISPQNAALKYTVTLPVKAGANNADEVSNNGKTLTWNLQSGQVNEVNFTASENILASQNIPIISNVVKQVSETYSDILSWVLVVLIALAIVILAFFAAKRVRSKMNGKLDNKAAPKKKSKH